MTSDIDAVPSEPTREQVNAALLAFYPSDWTRSIQFDAMKRALIAASLCEPATPCQSPDGRTIDKAMVKRLAVQYGLIDAAPSQSAEPVDDPKHDLATRMRLAREAGLQLRIDGKFGSDRYHSVTGSWPALIRFACALYASPQPAQTAQSGGAVPTLWEAFEMGFSLRSAMLGHVLDGRDVGRLTTCEFWHPSMLGMHAGTDLHVGLSVSEAIVKVKTEVRRRLNAFDEARVAAPSAVVLDDERAALDIKCIPKMPEHVLADLQSATTYLEMWAKGEALYVPKNGYDEPGIKTATITDVKKSAKYLAPRMREASFALQDYFAAIDAARAASPQATATPPAQTERALPVAGETWFVRIRDAGALATFEVIEVSAGTVLVKSPGSYYENRYEIGDLKFVERMTAAQPASGGDHD